MHDETQHVSIKLSVISKLSDAHPPSQRKEIAAESYLKFQWLADPSFGGPLDTLIWSLDYGKCMLGFPTYNISADIVPCSVRQLQVLWIMSLHPLSWRYMLQETFSMTNCKSCGNLTPEAPKLVPADEAAVHHFEDTHIIAEDGQYKVWLPKWVSTLEQSRLAAFFTINNFWRS